MMNPGSGRQKPILLIGGNGQVGWELRRTLSPFGPLVATTRDKLDLRDANAIVAFVRATEPALIVNAAAYTAVDLAEDEPDIAMAINGVAPGILAEEAKRLNCPLVHFSTDYVFDGTRSTAPGISGYEEGDGPNPLNVYGKSKLTGDEAVQQVNGAYLVLRTSWVYGNRGKNFFKTILRLARERDTLQLVNSQVGCPTWARLIAEFTTSILAGTWHRGAGANLREASGVYHVSAAGEASWHDFADAIVTEMKARNFPGIRTSQVSPIPSSEFRTKAKKPLRTVLNSSAAHEKIALSLPDWHSQLLLCIEERMSIENRQEPLGDFQPVALNLKLECIRRKCAQSFKNRAIEPIT